MQSSQHRKLNVLVVVRWPVGGIRTFLRYVYGRFPVEQYRFVFVYPKTSETETLKSDLGHLDVVYEELHEFPSLTDFSRSIFRCLKKYPVDIVHSHGFTSGICSIIPVKIMNKPHCMTSHDVFTKKQLEGSKGQVKKLFLSLSFLTIDLIHCVSFDARENLLSCLPVLKNISKRIIVIPNGIESERFLTEDRQDFRLKHDLTANTFLIGFFGRFMSQKGFKFLVQALELLKIRSLTREIKVLCFGWGGFIREEQKALIEKDLHNHFVFLPFEANIAAALRGVDVVAMPSLWEACGLLGMESLVAGVPIIGTDCVGLREVLKGTPAQIIPSGDSISLAKAIELEILSSTRETSERFREIAAIRFDAKNQEVALRKSLMGLVSSRCDQ